MTIRTILVDDEPFALKRMRLLVAEDPDIEIVAECGDGLQALEAIVRLNPDLLFLDIQMPELDGFEVLSALDPAHRPITIFATAYDQFALKAFKAHAVDYLLKPFSREELQESLGRAKQVLRERRTYLQFGEGDALLKEAEDRPRPCARFVVRQEERVIVVQAEDVEAIEAEANYMWIHRNREAYPIRGTLASLEQRLDPAQFHRCHRSWLVNIAHVKELVLDAPGGALAITRSGQRVPVSHRHRKGLEEALER